MDIRKPLLLRLSADRILALRGDEPRDCYMVNVMGVCKYPVYDALPAAIIDVRHNSTVPAAAPPANVKLGFPFAAVDGDLFIFATDGRTGSAAEVLLRYVAAEDRWETVSLPSGSTSFASGCCALLNVGGRLVVLFVKAGKSTRKSAGSVLGSDGRWRPLPPNCRRRVKTDPRAASEF